MHSKGKVTIRWEKDKFVLEGGRFQNLAWLPFHPERTDDIQGANAERIAVLWNAAEGMTTEEAVRWLKGEIFGLTTQQLTHILTLATGLGYAEAVKYLKHGPEMERKIRSICIHRLESWETTDDMYYEIRGDLEAILAKLDKEGA